MDTKILLIDDETRIRQTFARTLKRAGYTLLTAEDGQEGLALYHQKEPDIVLLDLRMPGMDGLEVLQAMREEDPEANVILVTGHDDQDVVIEALRAGAADLLPKPVDQTALERALRRAEERVHLKRKLRASQEALRRQNERLEEEIKARTAKLEREIEERKEIEKALLESEQRYKEAERVGHFGSWRMDIATGKSVWSDEFFRICGYEPGSIEPSSEVGFKIIHPDDRERAAQKVNATIETGTPYDIEKRIVQPDGTIRWVRSIGEVNYDEQGKPAELVGSFHDITERKQAEEASRQYTARLRIQHEIDAAILAAQSPEEIAQVALTRLCDLIACQQSSITEIDPVRRRGRDLVVLVGGKLQVKPTAWYPLSRAGSLIDTVQRGDVHHVDDITALETPSPLEQRLVENGIRSYVSMPLLVQDTLQGALNLSSDTPDFFQPDHVEILKEIADSLAIALQQARLREQAQRDAEMKALLLREVNHRVLNNLAAIMAILDMEQRRSLDDKADFRAVLHDVAHRIRGMTTVHRMLSGAQWRPLDLSEVVERVTHAALSGSPIQRQVEVVIDRPDAPLRVTSKQAIALALVINELTTNSVKYAFRDRAQGRIQVGITPLEGRRVRLTFRDDGPGMDDVVLVGERRNVGLWLVETNVKHTLGGEVEFHNEDGAVTAFTFKRAPLG